MNSKHNTNTISTQKKTQWFNTKYSVGFIEMLEKNWKKANFDSEGGMTESFKSRGDYYGGLFEEMTLKSADLKTENDRLKTKIKKLEQSQENDDKFKKGFFAAIAFCAALAIWLWTTKRKLKELI